MSSRIQLGANPPEVIKRVDALSRPRCIDDLGQQPAIPSVTADPVRASRLYQSAMVVIDIVHAATIIGHSLDQTSLLVEQIY